MSLMDIFKQATPPVAQPTTPAPTAPATTSQISANSNPTVPNQTNTLTQVDPATGKTLESPLANFAELWKTDPNAKPNTPFQFQTDPTKLLEASRGIDFTKVLSPELQARMNAGGSDGVNATREAMNQVAQLTFAQSANASAKIGEQVAAEVERRVAALLPGLVKQHSISDTLRTDNPLLSNPAAAPMVQALQQQLTVKYPNATAFEIRTHMNDYLNGVAQLIRDSQPTQPDANKSSARKETDWSLFG